jgi:hypothetical protein
MSDVRPRRPGETVFALLLLLGSLFLLHQAYGIAGLTSPSSAGFFPILASSVMLLAMVAVLVRLIRMPTGDNDPQPGGVRQFVAEVLPPTILIFIALATAYVAAMERAGFLISSFVFLVAAIWMLHRKNPLLVLGVSAGTLALIYVVFRYVFIVLLP